MKITKQVLKKMIKEELKQVQTNEGAFDALRSSRKQMDTAIGDLEGEDKPEAPGATGTRPVADASRVKKKRDANPGLTKAYEMINTLPEFLQVLRDLLGDVHNVKKRDVAKALRNTLNNLMKEA
jgi:hypothetical protein